MGLRPWLRRVVSNLCVDRMRSGKRLTVTDEVPEQVEPATQQSQLEAQDTSQRVDAALKALPDRQRTGADPLPLRGAEPDRGGKDHGHLGRGGGIAARPRPTEL